MLSITYYAACEIKVLKRLRKREREKLIVRHEVIASPAFLGGKIV